MKLKEVIKCACTIIGLDDLLSSIESETISQDQQKMIDMLVDYFNKVQEEIATEFMPVLASENLKRANTLDFSDLDKQILDVIYLKDKNKRKVSYELFVDHLKFDGEIEEIVYSFIPDEVGFNDDILFLVPKRVYAYAMAREYYLFEGLLDKATDFEQRFKNSVKQIMSKDKARFTASYMPKRLWL